MFLFVWRFLFAHVQGRHGIQGLVWQPPYVTLSQPGGQIMPNLYWGPWLARIRRGGPANILIQIYGQVVDYFEFQQNFCQKIWRSNTLK